MSNLTGYRYIGPDTARVRMRLTDRNTRHGGTISGPAMFTLADFSIYAALIGRLGIPAIPSVTSNLNITLGCGIAHVEAGLRARRPPGA